MLQLTILVADAKRLRLSGSRTTQCSSPGRQLSGAPSAALSKLSVSGITVVNLPVVNCCDVQEVQSQLLALRSFLMIKFILNPFIIVVLTPLLLFD